MSIHRYLFTTFYLSFKSLHLASASSSHSVRSSRKTSVVNSGRLCLSLSPSPSVSVPASPSISSPNRLSPAPFLPPSPSCLLLCPLFWSRSYHKPHNSSDFVLPAYRTFLRSHHLHSFYAVDLYCLFLLTFLSPTTSTLLLHQQLFYNIQTAPLAFYLLKSPSSFRFSSIVKFSSFG